MRVKTRPLDTSTHTVPLLPLSHSPARPPPPPPLPLPAPPAATPPPPLTPPPHGMKALEAGDGPDAEHGDGAGDGEEAGPRGGPGDLAEEALAGQLEDGCERVDGGDGLGPADLGLEGRVAGGQEGGEEDADLEDRAGAGVGDPEHQAQRPAGGEDGDAPPATHSINRPGSGSVMSTPRTSPRARTTTSVNVHRAMLAMIGPTNSGVREPGASSRRSKKPPSMSRTVLNPVPKPAKAAPCRIAKGTNQL